MTKTKKNEVPEVPSDLPIDDRPLSEGTKRKVPQRGVRKRVLGEGEGDYCVYEILGEGMQAPRGSLVPIPGVPRFVDTAKALHWIRMESGDLLSGKQVMIFRACEILTLRVQAKPTVVIEAKPKVTVQKGPETSNG